MKSKPPVGGASKNQTARYPSLGIAIAALGCLSFLMGPLRGNAETYYVDNNHPSANDGNPGTINLPWRTIQHAAETIVAGDTVLIRTGTYNEHVYIENDGNATAGHIVFSAYPAENPIIDGTGVQESQNGIIVDKTYIKLLGLEIQNWNDNAIWIENAAHLEISDCEVHDVLCGIGFAYGTYDFEVNRIDVHHFMLYGFDASPSGGAACHHGTFNDCVAHTGSDPQQNVDGFAIGHGTQHDFVFNRCETYGVYDGFDMGENENGSQTNAVLNRCSAHECANGGFKLWGDQVTLVNCLAYHNGNANIELDWGGNPGTTTLHSCTIVDSETFNIWVENSGDALHMYNCIVAGSDNNGLCFEQHDASAYQGDYNIFHDDDGYRAINVGYEDEFTLNQIGSGDWTAYSGQDVHSQVVYSLGDLFSDPASCNLHVLESSAAVDNGTTTDAPAEDFDGNPRPSGAGFDIGAFEYQFEIGVENQSSDGQVGSMSLGYFPHPVFYATDITYTIDEDCSASLAIYDLLGRQVRLLTSGRQSPGTYQLTWDGRDDDSARVRRGSYICRLEVGGRSISRRIIMLR